MSGDEVTVPARGLARVVRTVEIPKPHRWHGTADPYLYKASAEVVDAAALNAALTPHMRAAEGSVIPPTIDGRATYYGYGFNVSSGDASGRVRISHSGAFALGAGTTFLAVPDLDLGIVVLTNAAPVAANDSYNASRDATLTVAAPGVLANDNDANGNALTAKLAKKRRRAK